MPVSFVLGLLVVGTLLLPAGLICLRAIETLTGSENEFRAAERYFLSILVGLLVVSLSALVLAEIGAYSIASLVGIVFVLCTLAIVSVKKKQTSLLQLPLSLTSGEILSIVFLVIVSGVLFFLPHEYFFGGVDPGVYVNTAISIVRNGSLLFIDQEMAGLSEESRSVLFSYVPSPWVRSGLAGFTVLDFSTGVLEPHGFHLFPAWLAVTISLFGLKSGLTGMPVLALISVIFIFLLGQRFSGFKAGLVAALLFSTSISEVWFSRFPAAETMTQVFLLGGLLAYLIMLENGNRTAAIVAGLSFGAVHLTKIEMVFLPAAIFLFYSVLWVQGKSGREHLLFGISYVAVSIFAVVHAFIFAPAYVIGTLQAFLPRLQFSALSNADTDRPYTFQLAGHLLEDNILTIALLAVAAIGFFLAIELARRRKKFITGLRLPAGLASPYLFAISILVLASYAYFIRPIGSENWAGTNLTNPDSTSFVRLGWYISRPGLLLAVLGVTFLVLKRFNLKIAFILLLGGLAIIQTLSEGRITPYHFWAGRRLVPFVIPFAELMAGYAVIQLWRWLPNKQQYLPIVFVTVILAALNLRMVLPFFSHVEYEGSLEEIASISSKIPVESTLLVEWSPYTGKIAPPLKLVFDKSVFALSRESAADPKMANVVGGWLNDGKRVFWLSARDGFALSIPGFTLRPEGPISITVPEAELTTEGLPSRINSVTMDFFLYEVIHES